MADETEQGGGTESGDKSVAAAGMNYDPRVVPTTKEAKAVAKVAEKLYIKRQEACRALGLGLTKLYNFIKNKRGKSDSQDADFDVVTSLSATDRKRILELRDLHDQLNAAVCACYGWEPETWRNENEVLARLLELNRELRAPTR